LKEHPIGCGINLPDFVVFNKGLYALQKNYNIGNMYSDYLCVFRSLALHTGCTLKNLEKQTKTLFFSFCKFSNINPNNFQGVTLHELSQVENCFQVNINVYSLDEQADARILQRSRHLYPTTVNFNLYKNHFSYIKDLQLYTGTMFALAVRKFGLRITITIAMFEPVNLK